MPPEFVNTKPFPLAVRERPILFSAPMVRALLDGTKTQTRRVVKPQPWATARSAHFTPATADGEHAASVTFSAVDSYDPPWACLKPVRSPYGQPGDRLWVRETWNWFDPDELPVERQGSRAPFTGAQGERKIPWVAAYAADGHLGRPWVNGRDKWRPSIHMPRWASRVDLEVTGVRVERLQDISEADAIAEGIEKTPAGFWSLYGQADTDGTYSPRASYRALWESINGAGSWAANPWVWVIEFRRIAS